MAGEISRPVSVNAEKPAALTSGTRPAQTHSLVYESIKIQPKTQPKTIKDAA